MRIPLPAMMRAWRERDFDKGNPPRAQRFWLKLWAFAAGRPRLYHALAGLAVPVLGWLGRRKGRFAWLPLGRGWTRHRDFPAPQGRTFQQLWRQRRAGQG